MLLVEPSAAFRPDLTVQPERRRRLEGERDQLPELESFEPASLNLLFTWSLRNTTAAITARAMRATRRMYSTIDAPRSSLANFASSHVRNTNRFMEMLPSVVNPRKGVLRSARGNTFGTL